MQINLPRIFQSMRKGKRFPSSASAKIEDMLFGFGFDKLCSHLTGFILDFKESFKIFRLGKKIDLFKEMNAMGRLRTRSNFKSPGPLCQ